MMLAAAALVLARVEIFDDRGAVHSTDEWRGLPVIIAPVYTRCPVACPLITAGLKRAITQSKARPGTYRVVIFSFDPRDTPADLHRFRQRHNLPIDWTVASARGPDIRALMDSIGFQYAQIRGGYSHPNIVVGLTPELRVSKVLNGTEYRAGDIDDIIAGNEWLDRYSAPLFALLLFVAITSIGYLAALTARGRTRSRPADC
jgi:cytochrome oxidase Cu insertion factor (SCO1/SenC/PrrC family)